MRITFLLLITFLLSEVSSQSTLSGTLVDQKTQQPLSYVNVGVVGKNIGTVSAANGGFLLEIPEANYSDNIRISMIGYESVEMEVNQLEKQLRSNRKIDLKPTNYAMEEVVISASELDSKQVGNLKWKNNITAGFGEDKLGNELGILIKIKKRSTIIKDVTFVLGKNENDTVRFRLNVYSTKKGQPDKNILKDNIIIESSIKKGKVTTDLTDYNIVVQDDFIITLEWIEDYPEDSLDFSASLFGKRIWVRKTSQGDFYKVPIIGIGLSATILY